MVEESNDGWESPNEEAPRTRRVKAAQVDRNSNMEFEMEGFDNVQSGATDRRGDRGKPKGDDEWDDVQTAPVGRGGNRGNRDRGKDDWNDDNNNRTDRGGDRKPYRGNRDRDDYQGGGYRKNRDNFSRGGDDRRRDDGNSFRGNNRRGGDNYERRDRDRGNDWDMEGSGGGRPRRQNNDYDDDRRRGGDRGGRDYGRDRRGGGRRDFDDDESGGRGERRGPPRGDREHRGGGDREYGSSRGDRYGDDNRRDRGGRDERGGDRDRDGEKPKRVDYIPQQVDLEDEAFKGVKKGKNFDKYNEVEVKITGPGSDQVKKLAKFTDANFNETLMTHLNEANYKVPTPIQKSAIPTIMNGKDIMACAQTGSGKTAAFLLPIIENLVADGCEARADSCQQPEALIVAPTRELAMQIHVECLKFCQNLPVKTGLLYGGVDVRHQRMNLANGCNILIGTPGRINDFIGREYVDLSKIKYFVLDEADRMLDMGFEPIMKQLASEYEMPQKEKRQTLLFSATFPDQIQNLAQDFLRKDYLFIKVGILGGACSDVTQTILQVEAAENEKTQTLETIVKEVEETRKRTLVFVETKRKADFIACMLSQTNIPTTSIHGGRLQPEREKALFDFKTGKCPILVATSVAARGLDIPGVEHVINYELPKEIEEYVHRIGRTGRCGNVGLSTSFFDISKDGSLAPNLVKVLADAHQEVPAWLAEEAEKAKLSGDNYGGGYRHGRESRDNRGDREREPRNESGPRRERNSRKEPVVEEAEDLWGSGTEEASEKPRSRRKNEEKKQDDSDGWSD